MDKWGVPYVLVDGWRTRSRSSGGFETLKLIGIHHTADNGASVSSSLNWQYNTSPNKPIGNGLLDRRGVFHFGAAGAANTQGLGGPYWSPRGTCAKDDGNRNTFAIEAANTGVGETWPEVQQQSYLKLCAALIDWANNETPGANIGPGQVISHFEWAPTRKNDPFGPSRWSGMAKWDMNRFRGDLLTFMNGGAVTPTPPAPPTGGTVDSDLANGKFGLWPLNTAKESIRLGSFGQTVMYAQSVMKFVKNYAVAVDGDFGPQTEGFVKQLQAEHFQTVDGWVGGSTWGVIDPLAIAHSAPTPPPPPPPEPAPPVEPPPAPSGVVEVIGGEGRFQIHQEGRWPYTIAQQVYGDGNLHPWIVNFNRLDPNLTNWPTSGNYIRIPSLPDKGKNFAGVLVKAPANSGLAAIVGVAFPNESFTQRTARVPSFKRWNGNRSYFKEGEVVFVPADPNM